MVFSFSSGVLVTKDAPDAASSVSFPCKSCATADATGLVECRMSGISPIEMHRVASIAASLCCSCSLASEAAGMSSGAKSVGSDCGESKTNALLSVHTNSRLSSLKLCT